MRKAIGALTTLAGIALGVYWGVVIFIAGVVDIVDGAKADPTDGALIGWGVVKIGFLAGLAAAAVMSFAGAIGGAISGSKRQRSKRPTAKQVERDFVQKVWRSSDN